MNNDNFNGPQSIDEQQKMVSLNVVREGVEEKSSPLALDIKDEDLIKIVDDIVKAEDDFYNGKKNLKERRKKNVTYRFGRQIDDKEKRNELKKYESRVNVNVIYEIETSLKPLAMSHIPDMIVLPGSEDPEKQKAAKDLTLAVNDNNRKRKQRKTVAMGFQHLPVYFTACIKARWDQSLGKDGDYRFDIVHPNRITVGHQAKTNDTDEMEVIIETTPVKVQELFMRFPNKIAEIKEQLKLDGVEISDEPKWSDLAREVNILEVHYTWYKKKDEKGMLKEPTLSIFEPGVKWETTEIVIWKYKDVLLDKMLTPNYDYEGEEVFFTQDNPQDPSTKKILQPEDMVQMMMQGNYNFKKERIYHNYFDRPKKPYFLFGYEQWGEQPYDETSRIEQNIRNQENLDDMTKRIMDKLKQRVKHIWGKDSGLKSEDIQKMDMENPNLDALIDGDINKTHKAIDPERPDAAEYKSIQDTKGMMYGLAHATAIRGDLQSDVATTNQIGREADFTSADDLTEETVNSAYEWMTEWQVHFIKLRYTEEHMRQIAGADGATTLIRLRRDMPSDGMEVRTKASTTDKLKAQKNALESAKLGPPYTNPIDFFKDMDMDDPEGRAQRGLMMVSDPAGYYAKYVLKLENTPQLTQALGAAPVPGTPVLTPQQAPMAPPTAPANPTPVNTANVAAEPAVGVTASPSNGML